MRPGEIYLAQFPFGDVPGMKLRPVLLLTGPIGAIPEILVAYIRRSSCRRMCSSTRVSPSFNRPPEDHVSVAPS